MQKHVVTFIHIDFTLYETTQIKFFDVEQPLYLMMHYHSSEKCVA